MGYFLPINGPPKGLGPQVPPCSAEGFSLSYPEFPMTDRKALAREIAKRKPPRFVEEKPSASWRSLFAHFGPSREKWLMQAGVPLWQASGFLAMSEKMLVSTYGHHHPDYMREAADAIGRRRGALWARNGRMFPLCSGGLC